MFYQLSHKVVHVCLRTDHIILSLIRKDFPDGNLFFVPLTGERRMFVAAVDYMPSGVLKVGYHEMNSTTINPFDSSPGMFLPLSL